MVDRTHFWGLFGDAHIEGLESSRNIDPIYGQFIELVAAPTPPLEVGLVARGAISGCIGIVRRVISPTACVLEMLANSAGFINFAWTQNQGGPGTGESVNFDNGGSAPISFLGSSQDTPTFPQPPLGGNPDQHVQAGGDARLNATLPPDPTTQLEFPTYRREAKVAQSIYVATASLTGAFPHFRAGDRCTTGTGAFTVLKANQGATQWELKILRKTGTLSNSQVITNTTLGGGAGGTILASGGVGADPQLGTWLWYSAQPNIRGLGGNLGFDRIPDPKSVGPENRLMHRIAARHTAAPSPNDRGYKLLKVNSFEVEDFSIGSLGGVVVQVVRCTGTFPTTWTVGETVTGGGGWSGKVLGWNATLKYLYVVEVNGNTLTAGAVTGATSGAVATSLGAANGHQKGSSHWNAWAAEVAAAMAAPNALFMSSPAYWEGIALMHWETELKVHSVVNQCPYPTDAQAVAAWSKYIADLRTHLGRADLPITIWSHRPLDSQKTSVPFGAFLVYNWQNLAASVNTRVTRTYSDSYEMVAGSELQLRWQDYIDLGDQLYRHLELGQITIPNGGYRLLPVVIGWGQSQMSGNIPTPQLLQIDFDPELWPSASFALGAASTVDANCLSFNHRVNQIEPFDVNANENTFWNLNPGTCGPMAPVMARFKRRFSEDPVQSVPTCLFKASVNGSTCNPNIPDSAGCWDPLLTSRPVVTATCAVTVQPASGSIPARGRFTATPGTFSTSVWATNTRVAVTGSALGFVNAGGNNSAAFDGQIVYAIAGDGSWIELMTANFANEASRPFTFTVGPLPIWPTFVAQWNTFVKKATEAGWIPLVVAIIGEQGESDLALVEQYEACYRRVWDAMEALCAQRPKGAEPVAKLISPAPTSAPWGTDEQLAQLIAIHKRTANEYLTNCTLINTDDLPMSYRLGGPTIRTVRQDNDPHRTARGHITAGFRWDAALGALGPSKGIPAHPKGELAIDFGAVDGGVGGTGADSGSGDSGGEAGEDGPGTPGTGGLIVEDGTGIDDAESLCTVEQLDAFWAKNGSPATVTAATSTQKAAALRRATREWLEGVCGGLWRGVITHRNQRLSWPRRGAYDDEGRLVAESTIPVQLIEATAIVAGDLLAGGTILANGVDRAPVTRETKRGLGFEQTFEYAESAAVGSSSVRRLRAAEALVFPYVRGNTPGAGVTRS